jgi:SAM-dependent methyltransferase
MNWFEDWFNTHYYHILYKNRDEQEAGFFLSRLLSYLSPPNGSKFLDLACGKGRHSVYLHNCGYDVTGMDLSKNSISEASTHVKPGLRFQVQDMRLPFGYNEYDYIFNLFTSFGYFENETDNQLVINNIRNALKPGGTAVIDYLNPDFVAAKAHESRMFTIDTINFTTSISIDSGWVVKNITVHDKNHTHHFQERVKLIDPESFASYFLNAGIELTATFGDYNLSRYNRCDSARQIMVVKIMS